MNPEGKAYYSDDRRRAGEKFMNAEQEHSKEQSLKSKVAIAKVAIGDVMHAIGEKMTRPARYVKDRVSSWYDRRFNKKSESKEQSEATTDNKPEYKLPDDVNDLLQRFSRGEADLDDVTKGLAHSMEQANKAREAEQKAKLEAKPEAEKPKAESEEKKPDKKPETGDAKDAKPNPADGGESTSTTGDRPNRFKLPDLKVPDLKLQPEGDIPHSDFEPKPKAKPEAKPESKAESKPEVKPEPKLEAKPEAKPEVKPESKPETKGSANTESQQRPFFAYNKNGDLTQYSSREAYERAVAEDQKAAETESKGDTEATEEKYIPLSPEERRDGMEQLRGMHNVIMAAVTSYDVTRASQVINAYSEMLTSYANRGLDVDQLRLSSEDLQRIMYNAMIKEMSYARQNANRQPNFKPIANGAPDVWGNSGNGGGESATETPDNINQAAQPESGGNKPEAGNEANLGGLDSINKAIEAGSITEAQFNSIIDNYNRSLINRAMAGEKVADAMLTQEQISNMAEQLHRNLERNELRSKCDELVGQLRTSGRRELSKKYPALYRHYNKLTSVMGSVIGKDGNLNKADIIAKFKKLDAPLLDFECEILDKNPKNFVSEVNKAFDADFIRLGTAAFNWDKVDSKVARWYLGGKYEDDLKNNRKLSKFDVGRDGHNTEQKKPEAEQKAEAKPETEQKKTETGTEAKPETEKPKAESEEKKSEAKPEAEQKADAKPEAKSETKPETEKPKSDAKPESKPETEKPKAESEEKKPEAKPEPESEQKSEQESKVDEEAAYNELDQKMEREQAVFSGAMDGIDRFQRSVNDWRFQQGVESGHAVSNEDMQQQFGDLYGLLDARTDENGNQLPVQLTPEGRKMAFQMAAAEYDNSHDSAANGKHAAETEQPLNLNDFKQHVEAFNQFNAARQAKNEKPVSFYSYLVMNK